MTFREEIADIVRDAKTPEDIADIIRQLVNEIERLREENERLRSE